MSTMQHWLTVREVAGELQVHEETVRRWIRSGELAALELGGPRTMYRISPSDLSAFMRQRTRANVEEKDGAGPAESLPTLSTNFQYLVEQLPLVTLVFDPNARGGRGSLLYISPEIEQILGVPVEEWYQNLENVWPSLIPSEQHEQLFDLTAQLRATREHFSTDIRMVNRASGKPVWVRVDLEVDRNDPSGRELWYGLFIDVSHRKVVEEYLRTQVRVLDEMAGRLGPAMNLDRMIFEVMRDLRDAVPATSARFRLIGAGGRNLTSYTLAWGQNGHAPVESDMEISRAELGRNLLCWRVMQREQLVLVPDLRREARFSGEREILEGGARSALAVPVRNQVRIVAVLEVISTSPDAFRDGDGVFLQAAGSIAGLALARQGERWLTVPDVADMLDVRPETVRRWIRNGDLVAAMPGGVRAGYRIDSSQLNSFVLERQASG